MVSKASINNDAPNTIFYNSYSVSGDANGLITSNLFSGANASNSIGGSSTSSSNSDSSLNFGSKSQTGIPDPDTE